MKTAKRLRQAVETTSSVSVISMETAKRLRQAVETRSSVSVISMGTAKWWRNAVETRCSVSVISMGTAKWWRNAVETRCSVSKCCTHADIQWLCGATERHREYGAYEAVEMMGRVSELSERTHTTMNDTHARTNAHARTTRAMQNMKRPTKERCQHALERTHKHRYAHSFFTQLKPNACRCKDIHAGYMHDRGAHAWWPRIKQHQHAQSRHGAQYHAIDAVVFRCQLRQCPSCTHALSNLQIECRKPTLGQSTQRPRDTTLCGDVPEARGVCSGGAQHTCSTCTRNPARHLYPCLLATSCFEGLRTCSLPSSLC
jgi:hypothetical protein